MTKEKLEQYAKLKKEIKYLENKIAKLEKRNPMVADSVQIGFIGKRKKITVVSGIDVRHQDRISQYRNKLHNFKIKLQHMQIEIEEFIESIEDADLRLILRYRYEDGFSWVRIMHLMDYKTENTARMKLERFFEKI